MSPGRKKARNSPVLFVFLFCCAAIASVHIIVSSQMKNDVHNFDGKCDNCHVNIPAGVKNEQLIFIKGISQICLDCHDLDNSVSHPVDMTPSMIVPADLHLDWEGRMTCATCHDIHQKKRKSISGKGRLFLRRVETGRALCMSCHYKLLEDAHRESLDIAHVGFKYRQTDAKTVLDKYSSECLRCHDDVTGITGEQIPGGIIDHGRGGFSHPVGVRYPGVKSPRSRREFVSIMELPPQIKLIGRKIGCITCHDPYSRDKHQLVISRQQGALCLTCHLKGVREP